MQETPYNSQPLKLCYEFIASQIIFQWMLASTCNIGFIFSQSDINVFLTLKTIQIYLCSQAAMTACNTPGSWNSTTSTATSGPPWLPWTWGARGPACSPFPCTSPLAWDWCPALCWRRSKTRSKKLFSLTSSSKFVEISKYFVYFLSYFFK